MAVEVGTAYVTILPSTKGFASALNQEIAGASGAVTKSASVNIGGALDKVFKASAATGAATLGTALFKGFGRLKDIDQAKAKLTGLGNSAQTVQQVMDNALAAVKGTAFGMGEAASTAGVMVAAGIKPGQELQRVLSLVGDTATIAGTDMQSMGQIWGSVAARGKLQGDDMLQMLSRGIPVLQLLAQHYGITAAEASDMVSKGKVSFQDFASAMEKGMGGAALESGKTFSGAFDNMVAALGRLGAALLGSSFEELPDLFAKATTALDNLAPAAKQVAETFAGMVGWVRDNATWLGPLVAAIAGAAVAYKTASMAMAAYQVVMGVFRAATVAAALAQLGLNAALLANPIGLIIIAIGALAAAFIYLWNTNDGFREAVTTAWDAVKAAVGVATDWITGTAFPAIVTAWDTVKDAFFTAKDAIIGAWNGIVSAVSAAKDWIVDAWNTVRDVLSVVWAVISGKAREFGETVKAVFDAVWFAARFVAGIFATVVVSLFQVAWLGLQVVFKAGAVVVENVWAAVRAAAELVSGWYQSYVAPVLAVFWRGVMVVFDAGRALVETVWRGIQNATALVVSWYQTYVAPTIAAVWQAIQTAFGAARDFIAAAWDAITTATRIVVEYFVGAVVAGFTTAWSLIRAVFDAGRVAVGVVWSAITSATDAVVRFYQGTVQPAFAAVWGAIRGVFSAAWDFIRDRVFTPMQDAIGALPGYFENAKNTISRIWDGIKDVIAGPVRWVVNTVIRDGLADTWNKVAEKLSLPRWEFAGVGFASGGRIPGPRQRPGVDNLPGLIDGKYPVGLASGEWVINNRASALYGDATMAAVNAGKALIIPGLASGGAVWGALAAWAREHLPGVVLTSGYRPGANDYHGAGQAVDLAAPMTPAGQAAMLNAARVIAATFGGSILELIHTPAGPGLQLKNGRPIDYGAATAAQHVNHVHWAMASFDGNPDAADAGAGFSIGNPVAMALKALLSGGMGVAKSALGKLTDVVGGGSDWGKMVAAVGSKAADEVEKFLAGLIDKIFPELSFGGGIPAVGDTPAGAGIRDIVKSAAATRGWGDGRQWDALQWVIGRESGWNPNAQNPTSTAYGLGQFLDSTWASVGIPKTSDPRLQSEALMRYIAQRYGSPVAAQAFWGRSGWYSGGGPVHAGLYDSGGYLPPGLTLAMNATGRRERVLAPGEDPGGRGDTYVIQTVDRDNVGELVGALEHASRVARLSRRYRS